ncbi:GNAT family N-acetyltransferase [Psychrobacillus sp. NEAU-3TGS]|nr:GNAT family N-acetyltransferase [Psychrobacillus sp. NEAU-3TGS]
MFVFDALIKTKKQVVFYLHGLLESVDTPLKLSNYLKARNIKERYYQIETPFIDLQNLSYNEYMHTRKKLHGLDRREKKLHLLGDVRLQISPSTNMSQIFEVHRKRWEKKNDTSGFSSDKKKAFFKFLAEQNHGILNVLLTTLTLEDEIIAFTYGFSCRGRYLGYVLGHDSDFDDYGPGRILVKEKIKKNKDDGFHKLDMSIGYEPYKFDWNTDLDYTRKTIFSTNTFKAKVYRNFLWLKATSISTVKKNYPLVIFRRNVVGKLKYYLRNKDKIYLRKFHWKNKLISFMFERKRYLIAKRTESNIHVKSEFQLITPKEVLTMKQDRKNILQKKFRGFKGYYFEDKHVPFWVNDNVIRLDDIEVITNLKKRSVYIQEWEHQDLEKVISFVQTKYNPKHIFIHLSKYDKEGIKKLEAYGFQIIEKISYSKVFGIKNVKKEIIR